MNSLITSRVFISILKQINFQTAELMNLSFKWDILRVELLLNIVVSVLFCIAKKIGTCDCYILSLNK